MKIVVTGHNGYIGSILVPLLLKNGHEVLGIDVNYFEKCKFDKNYNSEAKSLIKDIRDIEIHDIEGYDSLVHLAALSNDPLGDLNPVTTDAINHKATIRLANIAKDAGIDRFIFSSSCSTYGAAGDILADEDSVLNPITPYGISKVLAEKGLLDLADENFSPVIMRNATAYGYSPSLRFDLVLNNLVAWAFTTGKIILKSDGLPWRPLVHIEDISNVIMILLEAETKKVHNQVFNIGGDEENYQIYDIAKIVESVVPKSKIFYSKNSGPDNRCYKVSCKKLKQTINYEFKWNVRNGAKELYDSYKKFNLQKSDFESVKYSRVEYIKYLVNNNLVNNALKYNDGY